ncbi:type II secretion system protein [Pelosinus sp. IPA-1]|uniref:PulJ/GspJ family protein n=1 Tax=Pelosinus sp. IPA-1 TaxID=3029569 RepID=UPI002436290E|nr:type II secretion system protein [Pelosinus sp. IPA-1]GMB00507.1 hypothetical protein PIPA1_33060 [Pelosinus sp. IPA-1]
MNNKGFTLIEMLVGIAIFIILIGAVLDIFAFSMKSYNYSYAQIGQVQDNRQILLNITNNLQNATDIDPLSSPFQEIRFSIGTDSYKIAFDTNNSAVTFTKNGSIKSVGQKKIEYLIFTPSITTEERWRIDISLKFKNDTNIYRSSVVTLNKITNQVIF